MSFIKEEKCDVSDDIFRAKHEEGMVRDSKHFHYPASGCVRKTNGKRRFAHAEGYHHYDPDTVL